MSGSTPAADTTSRREARALLSRIEQSGTPQRAAAERAYLKSTLRHVGTPVPSVRREVRAWLAVHPATHSQLFGMADALWAEPVHESRLAAVELLVARPRLVGVGDLPWIEAHLRECRTWALVDPLSGVVAAELAVRAPEDVLPVFDRWVADGDLWIRRSAVLGLRSLLRRGAGLDRLFAYGDALLPDTEFFVRKALGWVLREVAPRHPREVSAWLRRNMPSMNLVTLREPMRKLPDADELRALYDTRRNSPG